MNRIAAHSFHSVMHTLKNYAWLVLVLTFALFTGRAEDAPLFPDKNLEKAVRKHVFEKRDNDKPLVEADVSSLSTIDADNMGITNLAGLEKCEILIPPTAEYCERYKEEQEKSKE